MIKLTNNLSESLQIICTTWLLRDYAVMSRKVVNPIIVDIGSHIGISALYFNHRHPSANIHCYEPNPHTFSILKNNTKNIKNIKINNSAVHDFDGTTNLHLGDVAWGNSIVDKTSKSTVSVKVVSVSKICQKHVDLLKLDSEGSEFAIIEELHKSGKIKNIDRIVMEYHCRVNDNNRLKQTLSTLKKNKFKYSLGHDIRLLKVKEADLLKNNKPKHDFLIIAAWR